MTGLGGPAPLAPVACGLARDDGFEQRTAEGFQPIARQLQCSLAHLDLGERRVDAFNNATLLGDRGERNREARSRFEVYVRPVS